MKLSIEEVQSRFAAYSYHLVSTTYSNRNKKLEVLCPQGHIYNVSLARFQQGWRCKECKFGRARNSFGQVKRVIEDEGYQVLSNTYQNHKSTLRLKCPEGHLWETTWQRFQYNGDRCKECYFNRRRKDYTEVENIFAEEGYRLVASAYHNVNYPLEVECPSGHKYEVLLSNFKRGTRCPICQTNKGEARLGQILEQMFPISEIRAQDNLGLLDRQTVDYSIRNLRLAFEYDGQQHFEPVRWSSSMSLEEAEQRLKRQQKCDQQKNRLCRQHGIRLIRIPYTEELSINNVRKLVEQRG